MNNKDILLKNTMLALQGKLEEEYDLDKKSNYSMTDKDKILVYKKDRKYKASYVDKYGEEHPIEIEPEEDMYITDLLEYLRETYDDFFKLIGIVESKNETIEEEYAEEEKLEEAVDEDYEEEIEEEQEDEKEDFKKYVLDYLGDTKRYIKDTSNVKPNRYDEYGIYLYGYDFYEEDDPHIFKGLVEYVPYISNKNTLNNLLNVVIKNFDTAYKDSIKLEKGE